MSTMLLKPQCLWLLCFVHSEAVYGRSWLLARRLSWRCKMSTFRAISFLTLTHLCTRFFFFFFIPVMSHICPIVSSIPMLKDECHFDEISASTRSCYFIKITIPLKCVTERLHSTLVIRVYNLCRCSKQSLKSSCNGYNRYHRYARSCFYRWDKIPGQYLRTGGLYITCHGLTFWSQSIPKNLENCM